MSISSARFDFFVVVVVVSVFVVVSGLASWAKAGAATSSSETMSVRMVSLLMITS